MCKAPESLAHKKGLQNETGRYTKTIHKLKINEKEIDKQTSRQADKNSYQQTNREKYK